MEDITDDLVEINNLLETIPEDKFKDIPEISHIAGNIYVGDKNALQNLDTFECAIVFDKDIPAVPNFLRYDIKDNQKGKIEEVFDETYNFIITHIDRKIIVISTAGLSRAATIVIYYLLRRYKKTNGKIYRDTLFKIFQFYISKRVCDMESTFIYKLIKESNKLL